MHEELLADEAWKILQEGAARQFETAGNCKTVSLVMAEEQAKLAEMAYSTFMASESAAEVGDTDLMLDSLGALVSVTLALADAYVDALIRVNREEQ